MTSILQCMEIWIPNALEAYMIRKEQMVIGELKNTDQSYVSVGLSSCDKLLMEH